MIRLARASAWLVVMLWSTAPVSALAQPLGVATGVVKKATPNVLIMVPRAPNGQFGKALTLKIRGTSRVTVVSQQTRDKSKVAVQHETEAKTLQPNQPIAVIYTFVGDEAILLSAVAEPPSGK